MIALHEQENGGLRKIKVSVDLLKFHHLALRYNLCVITGSALCPVQTAYFT